MLKTIILGILSISVCLGTPILNIQFPNPNLNESVPINKNNFSGYGAHLYFFPGSTWSVSWEDLPFGPQRANDADFNDYQAFVFFDTNGTGTMNKTENPTFHAGWVNVMFLDNGETQMPSISLVPNTFTTFTTTNMTPGQIVPLFLQTNQGWRWTSGPFNDHGNELLNPNFTIQKHTHAIIECVFGNCSLEPVPEVPEPVTMGLVGFGLIGVYFLRKKTVIKPKLDNIVCIIRNKQ